MKSPRSFKPKKSLGQYFLISSKIADQLISSLELTNQDEVLEIGAGCGILTIRLCDLAKKVYAIEIDPRLVSILSEKTKQYHNLQIINDDILNLQWQQFKDLKIIGNIPYHLSTEIFNLLLAYIDKWQLAVITTQREFADKLIAKPNSPNYCAMTVLFQFYTECQKILNIRPTEFKPQPKVTSSAILIKKNPTPLFNDITYHSFSKIVQIAFSYPRKTIANNLSLKLTIDKNLLRQIPNLNLNKRAQNYSLFEYYLLTKHLKSLVNL